MKSDRRHPGVAPGEFPEQEAALQEIYQALKPGGILSVTEIIFDPHFQSRESVQRVAGRV